MDVVQTVTGAI